MFRSITLSTCMKYVVDVLSHERLLLRFFVFQILWLKPNARDWLVRHDMYNYEKNQTRTTAKYVSGKYIVIYWVLLAEQNSKMLDIPMPTIRVLYYGDQLFPAAIPFDIEFPRTTDNPIIQILFKGVPFL